MRIYSPRITINSKRVGFTDIYNGSKEEVHQINAYSKITTLSRLFNNTDLVIVVMSQSSL
ncbi:hypothetical protein YN1HA_18450 [Sulfurisphaera ohwakuensis]